MRMGLYRDFSRLAAVGAVVLAATAGTALAQDPGALMGGAPAKPEAGVPVAPPTGSRLPALAGTYTADGRNADGSRYAGTVVIRVEGDTASFRWDIAGQVYTGRGTLAGNVLTVDWGQADPVIYIVNDDGTLSGTWDRGRASERLIPR